MFRSFRQYAVIVALVSLTGVACTEQPSSDRETVFPVQGKVLAQGQPAEGALVVFHLVNGAESKTVAPNARVQADGSFALGTYETDDGAPPGEYVATITWPAPPAGPMPDPDLAPDRLRGRYSNPQNSPFRVRVEEKENQLGLFVIP